jgi:hypothetical protein
LEIAMVGNLHWRAAAVVACMALWAACGVARAQEVPLVTGEHWMKSSEEMKKAYLVGIANITHIEIVYQGSTPAADAQSVLPRLVKGLKGHSLDTVREGLNRWYAAHPDRLQRPVIETLWFEMVVPGLAKNK